MGRRDEPYVDPPLLVRADGAHRAALEDVQQLGLHRRRHLANLVEKERASRRLGHQPLAGGRRARERPLHVTEELTLQQVLGERRAVDRHEGPLGADPRGVHRPGKRRLARARLAYEEDGRRGVGDARDHVEHFAHARAGADEVIERRLVPQGRAQRARLATQPCLADRAIDEEGQLVDEERLGQVVIGALADRFDRGLDGGVGGHHDDGALGGRRARPRQKPHAVDLGHAQIGDHGLERLALEPRHRLDARRAGDRVEAAVGQPFGERLGEVQVVVHDEHARGHRGPI